MTDGIFDIVADHPDLDPDMVVIGGVSLGGSVAIRCAAYDRRLLGAMAVTPVYDPMSWWGYVNDLVRLQLVTLVVERDDPEEVVAEFGLADLVPRLRSPILVFGAGRDMVVPPEESVALAAAAGELGTLVWYPEGGHGLYGELPDWMELTATWVNGLSGREQNRENESEPDLESANESNDPPSYLAPPVAAPLITQDRRDAEPHQESTRVDTTRRIAAPAATLAPESDDEDDPENDRDLWDG